MKIWSFTFGCKVNQYETELLRHRLTGPDDRQVKEFEEADLCLINSCSVTAFADKECRQLIRRVLRTNTNARVIVTGCYATRVPDEVQDISDRIEVYTNQEKEELPSCVGYEVSEKPLGIHQFAGRTRAFLKIQDGCKAPCNYCIIPTVRPDLWSKPVEQVLTEAQALLKNGYNELVLTGIRLGLYRGQDKKGKPIDLVNLLKKMVHLEGEFRIRLSSLEVTEVTDRLIQFVSETPQICRHFHIPMQAGDSQVLKDMQRWYSADYYKERIDKVRKIIPDCGITADVMVGYPTESDNQFWNTYKLIETMELSGLHVFRFSARATTPAAKLKPIDPKIVTQRAHDLGNLNRALRDRFYQKHRGTIRQALPEPSGEAWTDNYIRVVVPADDIGRGLIQARVQKADLSHSEGKPQEMYNSVP